MPSDLRRRLASFCALPALFVAFLVGGQWLQPKGWLVLWFAEHRDATLTQAFRLLTELGDGACAAVVVVMVLVLRSRNWLQLALACIAAGLMAQLCKHWVVGNVPRPAIYFHQMGIPFAPLADVKVLSSYSFPSGHTASAFALFGGLSMLVSARWNWCLSVLPIAIGLSRIYLGHHFASDVLGGVLMGLAPVVVVFWLLPPRPRRSAIAPAVATVGAPASPEGMP